MFRNPFDSNSWPSASKWLSGRRIRCLDSTLLALIALNALVIGCRDGENQNRWMPAPVTAQPPYRVIGQGALAWGDTFKMLSKTEETQELHQCVLLGIDTPKPGQKFYTQATATIREMIRRKPVELHVVRRDRLNHECGFVYQGDLDVGLELIRLGLGWYDGEEFDGAQTYRDAEAAARKKRIGLWVDNDPIPPWEFHEREQSKMKEKLKASRK